MGQVKVQLYGKSGCAECGACEAWLVEHGIEHEWHDTDTVDGMMAFSEAGWSDHLPLLLIDGHRSEGAGWRKDTGVLL